MVNTIDCNEKPDGEVCSSGICCNQKCVNFKSDFQNCGGCGKTCNSGKCANGKCTCNTGTDCVENQKCCDACSMNSDKKNCKCSNLKVCRTLDSNINCPDCSNVTS